jgi:penicillin-binding protein 2
MLIFDQLKKDDPQLRFMAVMVLGGMGILFAGLWWVQVVSAGYYQDKLETQSLRSVRIPAIRGKIVDRDGRSLAENRPSYNINLYLEDLSAKFQAAYATARARVVKELALQVTAQEKRLKRELTKQEKKQFALTLKIRNELQQQTHYEVSSNIVADVGARLGQSIPLEEKDFQRHYDKQRAIPLPVLANLNSTQVARFEEQSIHTPGMDLDIQSLRFYPNNTVAAHLLGYLGRNNDSSEGEPAEYNYRMDDYIGLTGIEKLLDKELRGMAGAKSVLVNNLGYRQRETVWSPAEPGENVVLTVDLDIQKAAETALQAAQANARGAVVVMDARNGDVLAMASNPTYDPNFFAERHDPATSAKMWEYLNDKNLRPQWNRAMQENYAPGSIFKIVVGLAALEQGLNPEETFHSLGYFPIPGRKPMGDTAGAGDFNFSRALAKSSNPYFATQALKPGVLPKIVVLGRQLHLGERTGLVPRQETAGHFPTPEDVAASSWRYGDTANFSIGQGPIVVTPLQMAVMTAAVANGGKVFWPRLVTRIEPYGAVQASQSFPEGRLRDTLRVSARSLRIVRDAMTADVETAEGTGHAAAIPGWRIAGKTGTAEVEKNGHIDKGFKNTWFVSFAPVENPRYVVVATVEGGGSGGKTCAPIAHDVYLAIQKREQQREKKTAPELETLAQMQ